MCARWGLLKRTSLIRVTFSRTALDVRLPGRRSITASVRLAAVERMGMTGMAKRRFTCRVISARAVRVVTRIIELDHHEQVRLVK